jgi:hypothetical protein
MKIKMINSVGEYVAGKTYRVLDEIPEEVSDRFLAAGYAEGDVAGDYDETEWAAFVAEQQAQNQAVSV